PRIDAKAYSDFNHRFSVLLVCEKFHYRNHVEHLVHLAVVGCTCLANDVEQGRWSEEVVLYHSKVRWKVFQALGLSTTAAVNQSVYGFEFLGKYSLHHRCKCAGGSQQQLTYSHFLSFNLHFVGHVVW